MTRTEAETGRRGRGRPPRLSRERIVVAAVGVLEADPHTSLTIKQVAEAVGAAPMALYRYFPDRDTLLQAAADHVLTTMERIRLDDGPWQEQLRVWMRGSHARLRGYPQLLPYLTSTRHPAWLPALGRLARLLAPAGLDEERLALAVTVISSTVMGSAFYESHRPSAEQTAARLEEELADGAVAEADTVRPLLARLPGAYAALFDTVLDRTVATVEELAVRTG
ncbi:regulatory protein TetR [Actinobacteria bacterium OK074]|nr:regulatory protein TetR [Actinobacteria bacterium OK074]